MKTITRKYFPVALACLQWLTLFVFMAGCGKQYVAHPGSVDSFDSHVYDVLISSQAALDSAKQQYASGQISGDTAKTAINKAGAVYNELRDEWLVYRGFKQAGKDATDAETRINALIPQMNTAINDLRAIFR